MGKDGKPLGSCPLKHTDVTADIAGFIARVTVRQEFYNSFQHKIEPGETVEITISYSETLDWKEGMFHLVFPMVVGPRYIPGQPAGRRSRPGARGPCSRACRS